MKYFVKYIFEPSLLLSELKRKRLEHKFKSNKVIIGNKCSVCNSNLGWKVYLSNNVSLSNVSIGSYSYINANSSVSNCKIGKFCSIASSVNIGLSTHPINLVSTHPAFYSNNKGFETFAEKDYFEEHQDVIIEHDVWIGNGATVMGGVKIGTGAIVAAGAIVTKDVRPYSIVGGIPAKHIKFRISEELTDELLKTEWWNNSEEWFRANYKKLHDSEEFIKFYRNK